MSFYIKLVNAKYYFIFALSYLILLVKEGGFCVMVVIFSGHE